MRSLQSLSWRFPDPAMGIPPWHAQGAGEQSHMEQTKVGMAQDSLVGMDIHGLGILWNLGSWSLFMGFSSS